MSQGKVAGALICLFIVATSAGTVAAWNYSAQSVPLFAESAAIAANPHSQSSNQQAKTDRLPLTPITPILELTAVAPPAAQPPAAQEPAPAPARYAVAALTSTDVEPLKSRKPPVIERPKRVRAETARRRANRQSAQPPQAHRDAGGVLAGDRGHAARRRARARPQEQQEGGAGHRLADRRQQPRGAAPDPGRNAADHAVVRGTEARSPPTGADHRPGNCRRTHLITPWWAPTSNREFLRQRSSLPRLRQCRGPGTLSAVAGRLVDRRRRYRGFDQGGGREALQGRQYGRRRRDRRRYQCAWTIASLHSCSAATAQVSPCRPPQLGIARDALAATATWVTEELDLTLRVALVPVSAPRAQGADVRVARVTRRPTTWHCAMFSGGGLAWADAAMKAGEFRVAPARPARASRPFRPVVPVPGDSRQSAA